MKRDGRIQDGIGNAGEAPPDPAAAAAVETYADPILGTRRVDELDAPDILRALSRIWLAKPETARRGRLSGPPEIGTGDRISPSRRTRRSAPVPEDWLRQIVKTSLVRK